MTLTLLSLLITQTFSRTCRPCGGSAYYDVRRPQHRYIKTVCGDNGLTYKNRCYARCNKVRIAHRGACNTNRREKKNIPCNCSNEWDPVQTLKGVYRNKCIANCKGLEAWKNNSAVNINPVQPKPEVFQNTEIPKYFLYNELPVSSVRGSRKPDPRNSDSGDSHSSHSRSTLFSRSNSSSEANDLRRSQFRSLSSFSTMASSVSTEEFVELRDVSNAERRQREVELAMANRDFILSNAKSDRRVRRRNRRVRFSTEEFTH